jgi:hypothetical protein
MLLGTATAGATVSVINLNFLPEYIYFACAADPTGLRIDIEGDGNLVNLDAAGLAAMAALNMPGRVATGYMLQLSDGLVQNKVVTITFTNTAGNAATPIWGRSKHKVGVVYVQMISQACLANSGKEFTKFAYLALPAAVTLTDMILIEYSDGLQQRVDAVEIHADNSIYQNNVPAAVQGINNSAKRISKVSFQPALAQNAYVVRLQPVGVMNATF